MVLITPAGTDAMYDVKMCSANSSPVHRQEVLEALPQLAFGHRGEVGTAGAQLDRERAVIGQAGEIGQRGLSEHPRRTSRRSSP